MGYKQNQNKQSSKNPKNMAIFLIIFLRMSYFGYLFIYRLRIN